MNILIIGNGFDLAHGLPTTYSDVLNFLYYIRCTSTWHGGKDKFINTHLNNIPSNEFLFQSVTNAFDSRIETEYNNCSNSDSKIQEIYDNLDDNIWFSYLREIYIKGKMKGINWIDFESEISFIIEQIDRTEQNLYLPFKKFSSGEHDEKVQLFLSQLSFKKYLESNFRPDNYVVTFRDFLDKSYSDLRRLVRCIEIYFLNYVEKIPVKEISPDIQNVNPNAVLCFNYTHTFIRNYSFEKEIDIHYIHGETQESAYNNMVLGIDEYYSYNEKDKYTNYNIYKKFTQRILYETGFTYRKWINKMDELTYTFRNYKSLEDSDNPFCNNIFIFGHSLDVTDADVLQDLIDRSGVKTTIFYYDKQQQTQQIANLVKMLGQEKFIKMINSVPQQICFIQQNPMAKKE